MKRLAHPIITTTVLAMVLAACSSGETALRSPTHPPGSTGASPTTPGSPSPTTPAVSSSPPTPMVVGPRLDPKALPPLPLRGIVVAARDALVFVGLDGKVYGHIDDFRLDDDLLSVGVLALSGGQEFAIDPAARTVRGLRGARVPLDGGALLTLHPKGDRGPTNWTLLLADGRRIVLPRSQLSVSEDRDLVSVQVFRIRGGFAQAVSSRVVDVVSGRREPLPPSCSVADRRADTRYLVCWPSGRGHPSWIGTLGPRGGVRRLVPAPRAPTGRAAMGHWAGARVSPDGSTLLLQWSGECEVPTAYVAPASGGAPRAVVPGRPLVESTALGWAPPAHPVVFLPQAVCGAGIEVPGVYLFSRSGRHRLVYQTNPAVDGVLLWRPQGPAA